MSKKSTKKTAKQTKGTKAAVTPKSAAKPKAERKPAADAKPKRISALAAAAEVLRKAGEPLNCPTLITKMADAGLWTSPHGATPHATLHAAINREIKTKGKEARFRKAERGKFEYAEGGR